MKRICIMLVAVTIALSVMPSVVITQVLYDTPLNEEINRPPYSNGEFVELHNTDCSPVELTGWFLRGGGKTEIYNFPVGCRIPANGYLAVAYRHNLTPNFLLDSIAELPESYTVLYQRKIILSNSGEGIALYNASNARVDTMRYTARQAVNPDLTPLLQCLSMHRVAYACDENGNGLCRLVDWKSDTVCFGGNTPQLTWLPSTGYYSPSAPVSTDVPYMVSITARSRVDSISSVDGQVCINGGGMANVAVEWCNPLGKSTMLMQRKQTPARKNLVSFNQNTNGYTLRQWLPVPVEAEDLMDAQTVASLATAYYEDGAPFAETRKEQAAQGRVIAATRPGAAYQNHAAHNTYSVNADNEVGRWRVMSNGATKNGSYPAGMLHKYTHADEDGKTTTQYVNTQGQVVMMRIANDAETYYLYDDLGRLRYVLPPLASSAVGNSFTDETDKILQFAYIYRYDDRGNCIWKKLPGCEPLYMVYDMAGRQVLSQDGNQRRRGNYWTRAGYTPMGELAITAEILVTNSTLLNEQIQYWKDRNDTISFSTENGDASAGYAIDAQSVKPLVVNYYDTYDFLALLPNGIRDSMTYCQRQDYGERHTNATGLLTGKRVYSLSDSTYTVTAYYYDRDGHVVQQRSTLWSGGYDMVWAAYNFDGTVSKMQKQQPEATETYLYEYDMAGRLLRTRYQLNNEQPVLLSNNAYTELGQLATHRRHDDADTENFQYDIRGNTTKIVSGDFTEDITYIQNGHGYNGTVSGISLTQDDTLVQWEYNYDDHNRLSAATWTKDENIWSTEEFTYDPMGNILTLKRKNQETLIDDLAYSYAGNQLVSVSDDAGEQGLYSQKEYRDLSNEANEMIYDENGNLLADFDRKICTIRYNVLNLPEIIQFCNGNSIVNTYNAEGVKLSSTYYTLPEAVAVPVGNVLNPDTLPQAPLTMTVQYMGHLEKTIINDSVSYTLHTPEGYISMDSLNRIVAWNYFRRDHLGNNVAVWNATADTTVQRMFYYPSGLPMSLSMGQSAQPYKYNGKEYDEMHGYDVYDYGFRGYYASVARFTSIDPLCERTPWQSPYGYASNNFTGEIDWMGLFGSGGIVSGNYGTCHYIVVNQEGLVIGYDLDSPDHHVYMVDPEEWDGKYESLKSSQIIGWEIPGWKEYHIGEPCYYLGYTENNSLHVMYGFSIITGHINSTYDAFLKYLFGDGTPQQNGLFAMLMFALQRQFWTILAEVYLFGKTDGGNQNRSINMEFVRTQFHIGHTSYNYYVEDNMLIIGYGLNDGFWDANFVAETVENVLKYFNITINDWEPDREGPNLEILNGTPYPYAPSVIILPY